MATQPCAILKRSNIHSDSIKKCHKILVKGRPKCSKTRTILSSVMSFNCSTNAAAQMSWTDSHCTLPGSRRKVAQPLRQKQQLPGSARAGADKPEAQSQCSRLVGAGKVKQGAAAGLTLYLVEWALFPMNTAKQHMSA